MKLLPYLRLSITTLLLLGSFARLQAADSNPSKGTIEGRVFNTATGAALVNARVTLAGTHQIVVTDESGSYRLRDVTPGEARVTVLYIGLESQTATVVVGSGATVRREFELSRPASGSSPSPDPVVQLRAYTVVADREMSAQAVAMNEQRQAPNLKNVVALDEFGDRGLENVGEFLHFLPGVAVDAPGDSGPEAISLRGFPASNSGVLIDGGELASARGATRAVDLRDVPFVNVSRIEVTKVPTPDMPASGLGGSINLITKSGFESKRPTFSYDVSTFFHNANGVTFDWRRHHVSANSPSFTQPSLNLSYLYPVNNSLAVTVGFSRTWRLKPMDDGERTRNETPTWNQIGLFQRRSIWESLAQLYTTNAGQIGLDWRITPSDVVSFGYQRREYSMYVTRSILEINFGAGATGNDRFTQGAVPGVGTATQNTGNGWYEQPTEQDQFTLKYRHSGNTWRIDANSSFSLADYARKDIDNGHFFSAPSTQSNLVIRGEDLVPNGIFRKFTAVTRTGVPVDIYDGGSYPIVSAMSAQQKNKTDKIAGRINAARDFRGVIPFTLKFGGAVDRMHTDIRAVSKTWTFRPNGTTDANARVARNFDVFDEAFLASAPKLNGTPYREPSLKKLYDLYLLHPDWFALDEPGAYQNQVTGSRELSETISAGYGRADVRLLDTRLWLVGGGRFERTEAEGRGPLNDLNAQYQRDARGNFIRNAAGQRVLITNDALALRKLRFQERAAHAQRTYDGFYPSLNATYTLSEALLLRAGYAHTLGRPNLNFIIPGTTTTDADAANPTITVNNTGLKPWTADSYDFTLESYNFKDGFGSIGVFQKNIKNFFGSVRMAATPELLEQYGLPTDGTFHNYEIATQENVGDAKITGFEFTYRQSLTFLPNWAQGFQIFVNYTKLKLQGSTTTDFSGFTPSKAAGGINFIRPRYFIKLTYSYQGETRRGAVAASVSEGITPNTYVFQGEYSRLSLNAQYSLTKRCSLYMSITDLGGSTIISRRYSPDTPVYARGGRYQENGYYTVFGVKGTF